MPPSWPTFDNGAKVGVWFLAASKFRITFVAILLKGQSTILFS